MNLIVDGRWRSTGGTFDPSDAAQRRTLINVVQHEIGHNFDTNSEIQQVLPGTELFRQFEALESKGIYWTSRDLSTKENFANAVDSTATVTTYKNSNQRIIAQLFDNFYTGLAKSKT